MAEHAGTIRHFIYPLPRNHVEHPEYCDGTIQTTNRLFPECGYQQPVTDESDYRRFHLRYYLPTASIVSRSGQGIDRVFVLINGLAEFTWYTLYDQIGQFLARRGIAAVLLPLPNHLIRHPRYRGKVAQSVNQRDLTVQALQQLAAEPSILFKHFLQYVDEFTRLVSHLRHRDCPAARGDCGFFDLRDVRISLLGYSLGGLVALALQFLDEQFNSCVLLNSGASLEDITLPADMISRAEWLTLVRQIEDRWERDPAHFDLSVIFERIFLGTERDSLRARLQTRSSRIMVIVGGADSVVPLDGIADIEPAGHGLYLQKIPGLGHFLATDRRWDRWLHVALEGVVSFDSEAGAERFTSSEVLVRLAIAQRHHRIVVDKRRIDLSVVPEGDHRVELERQLRIARALHVDEGALARDVLRLAREQLSVLDRLSAYDKLYWRVRGGDPVELGINNEELEQLVAEAGRVFDGALWSAVQELRVRTPAAVAGVG